MKTEKLAMCRICLAQNVRMYVVVNKNMQELYEKLTDVPFVTEDCRPMLACFFCCTRMKQCEEFRRTCLQAEELFSKMLNEDCESNSSINHGHLEFYGGFIKTSMVLISIDDTCQMECNAIKEELPDVDDIKDEIIQPVEEILGEEHLHNSYSNVDDMLDTAPHHSGADSENDVLLIKFATGLEKEEKRGFTVTVTKSQEDTTTDKQKKNEPSDSRIMRNTFSSTSKSVTKSNKTFKPDQLSLNRITNYKREKNTHVANNPYKCETSQRCFSEKGKLAKHIRIHNDEKRYECKTCQRVFKRSSDLKIHIRIHTGEKPYKCEICRRSFSQKCNLARHIRLHTGEKAYECDICQCCFKEKSSLANHIRNHSGEKPYKCEICQRCFSEKGKLARHIRIHTGEKPYKCQICQRSFSQKSNLTSHIRIHTSEKPYKCEICQSCFSGKGSLARHVRNHSGEKPYKCEICQRCFNEKSNLARHIRLHTGEKPSKCEICRRSFSHKSILTSHMRIHIGEKPHKCEICQRCFNEKSNLAKHIRLHNDEKRYECKTCQRVFKRSSDLKKHIRIHTGVRRTLKERRQISHL